MANRMMEVKLHPSSMLFLREKELHSEILAYNTLIMGNKEYQRNIAVIRDATSVDPVALVLLTRDIKIQASFTLTQRLTLFNVFFLFSISKGRSFLTIGFHLIVLQEQRLF
jgi:hypothetical protein